MTDAKVADDATALLIRARSFIERGWCRGAAAANVNGLEVHATSKQAIAWCALGALDAAGLPYIHHIRLGWHPAYRRLQDVIGDERLQDWNARQGTSGPVSAAFDRAITQPVSERSRTGC
jgi:hypothetical protein